MSDPMSKAALYGLAALPARHMGSQRLVARFLAEVARHTVTEREREKFLRYVDRITLASGIETRASVLQDYTAPDPEAFELYPKNWALEPFPGTAARMRMYEARSVELAEPAAKAALGAVDPQDITHLIVTSCTGFFAPGPDVALVDRLGLRADVERTIVGFMGCYAHFAALRLADRIVRADPDAAVLTVAVELCSLHYQKTPTIETLIANSLFADGAAAAVLAAPGRYGPARAVIGGGLSVVRTGAADQMSWRIGDHGFVMMLDGRVPETLGQEAPRFLATLLDRAGVRREEIGAYAVHPGGRKVVESIGHALRLSEDEIAPSLGVLRRFGNMSSATILFVLDEELRRLESAGLPGHVAMLGFGPGLTMEGTVLLRAETPG